MVKLIPSKIRHSHAVILHVEDDPATRYATGRLLQREGFTVTEATTGEEGLKLLEERPDLVILDVNLPDLNGFEVCRRIKADPATATVPVLHLSASHVTDEAQARGLESGADGYLVQPVDPDVLVATVKALLRLRRAEEEYRSIFENAVEGIFQATVDGRLGMANPALARMFGYDSPEQMMDVSDIGRHFYVDPKQRAEFTRLERDHGSISGFEARGRRKDGSAIWISLNARALRDRGEVVGYEGTVEDVTERKRAEAALKESEERYRLLVEGAQDYAIFMLDPEGRIANWNTGAERIFGYRQEEIVGKDGSILFTPEDVRQGVPEKELGKAAQEGIAQDERWHARRDGSRFWASGVVRALHDESGNLRGFVKVAHDLTQRKRAKEELREQEEVFRSLSACSPVGIFLTDLKGRCTYTNPRCQEICGFTFEEALGEGWARFVHPEDRGWASEEWSTCAREGREYLEEFRFVNPREGTRWVHVRSSPMFLDGGEPIGHVGTIEDVTERRQAEEEIRRRAHQQAVVSQLGQKALAETDLQVLMDEAVALVADTLGVEYCKVLELLPDEEKLLLSAGVGWKEGLVGRATVGAGLDSQAGYTLLSDEPVIVEDLGAEERFSGPPLLHEHGVVSGMSVIIHGRDGPFGVLGANTKEQRIFTEDDANFLQAVANVLGTAVQRKESEEQLREVREAERSRLARDLHDEAFQDLTEALAETQLVQQMSEDPKLNQRLERVGEALKRAGQGMHGAIYDLRLEGEAREQTLVEMLESLVELNRRGAPDREIELFVEEGFSPTLSRTKQAEVLRTLREALTNALRHSEANRIRIAVGTSGGKLWAEVEDDGRGFDPTKTDGGMGLKGMRERARALGGDLKISSKPGEGTEVRFDLALKQDQKEPEEEVRILLVEDHASVRQATASVFQGEPGLRVAGQAGSLSEARKMLDGVDVAVVDLGLPDGYGGELIEELRTRNPQAQALVLSAKLDRAEIARAVESGAAGVLHKSAEMDEVVEAVRRLRAGETLLPLEKVVELLRFAGSRREEEYEARQTIARLTSREKEVLRTLAEGLDSKEIAERLHISVKTEANHMTRILSKLGVHSRLQALVFAVRHGVIEIH